MPEMFGIIVGIAAKILEIVRGVKSLRRENAERAAALFDKISEALACAATDIRERRVPHGACGQITMFAEKFRDATKGVLDGPTADDMARLLTENCCIEKVAVRLQTAGDAICEASAARLEESSGRFRGLALLVIAKS